MCILVAIFCALPVANSCAVVVTDYTTDQVDEYVSKLLIVINDEISRAELMNLLGLKHSGNFRDNYLSPAMAAGLVEMTLPDAQNSKNQKYRLTSKGTVLKKKLEKTL